MATATDGTTNVSYTYDSDGIRTSKTVKGVKHTYVYASGKLLRETYGSNTLDFFYSTSGQPYALSYNGTIYYYITNLQGDVMSIVDGTGAVVVGYEYDPYGNILSTTGTLADTLGESNPLRYRGYVYDQECDLYYLQSRYYDAKVGRFLNPDSYPSTGQGIIGNNMFAYCGNNPIMHTDSSGHAWWHWAVAAAVVVAAAVAVVATAGGAAAAVTAVVSVANGVAASSTAATVAAGVFIGSATSFAASTYAAAVESDSIEEFAEHGETVMYSTIDGGIYGGVVAYGMTDQPCPSSCFVAGTHVQVANGTVPIESLEAGDVVWAWDEETGDVALKTVVETYVNETDELIHVFANGEEIVTTHSHPFYSPIKGWTDAVHLRAGDILVLVNGEYVVVEKVQHEILEAPVTVYNFQVEDYHTYYVACGILVHNRCHGNSLKSQKTNYGYQLQDSQGNILKYGETIHPNTRYSKAWLNKNGYSMKIMTSGSKQSVHAWQHQKILDYTYVAGHRPPLNKSFW